MNPLFAALIVIAATAVSVLLIRYVYGEERHRQLSVTKLVVITGWFLLTYGLLAFFVRPR